MGIRSPQESQDYPHVQILVPVTATSTVSGQNMSALVCTVGTSCATANVQMTVGGAMPPADPPQVSLPPGLQTTATGAKVPFTVNGGTTQYLIEIDTATNSGFTSRPCGGPFQYAPDAGGNFTGDFESGAYYGDLIPPPNSGCTLSPNTTYWFKVCAYNPSTSADYDCQQTTFATGSVVTTLESPAKNTTDRPQSGSFKSRLSVLGGHPAGNVTLETKLGSAGGYSTAATQAVTAATTGAGPYDVTASGLQPWRTYEVRSCFTGGMCSTAVDVLTGMVTSTDAQFIDTTSARVNARITSPRPAGTWHVRWGTSADALTQVKDVAVAVDNVSTSTFTPTTFLTGLTPATTYYWSSCVDFPDHAGDEDCSEVRSFTTDTPSGHDVQVDPPSAVGSSAATLTARVLGPHTGGTLSFRRAPAGGTPTEYATAAVAAGPADSTSVARTMTGLTGGTAYDTQVCYVASGVPTSCSTVVRLTTTGSPGSGGGTAADKTGPTVHLSLKGKQRIGKRLTVLVDATDASGIGSILVTIGSAKPKPYADGGLGFKLKKKTKITVVVADKAGNVSTQTLTAKPKKPKT